MPRITNFTGIVTDADTSDLPAGSSRSQLNVDTNRPGMLQPRKGIQPATLGSAVQIDTGYNTFQRMDFCKTRMGRVVGVNGIDRGFIWDGFSNATYDLGIDPPAAGPTVSTATIKAITNVTAHSGGQYKITSNGHGYTNGNVVLIGNIIGTGAMQSDLNGKQHTITRIDDNNYYIADTVKDGTYTSGGLSSLDGTGATKGTYLCAYRYVGKMVPARFSSISTFTEVEALTAQKFSWSNIAYSTNTRITKIEFWRSTADQFKVLYKVGEVANNTSGGTTTFTTDTGDDDALADKIGDDVMLVMKEDGTKIARRMEVPPDHFKHCVSFQDRYFYFGTVKYNKGTITRTGTNQITGSSTDWVSTMVGRYVEISGQYASFKVTAINTGTQVMTLDADPSAVSGGAYVMYPDPSARRQMLFSYQDEPESVPSTNSITIQSNNRDDDDIAGAMPSGSSLVVLSQRHKYALSFSTSPLSDGSLRYVDDRGVFNQSCWDIYENSAFIMDDSGMYRFEGGASMSISKPIQDVFRKDGSFGSIDYTRTDRFFVKVDRATERVYFFVCFVGDTGTYPKRAFVFNLHTESWDMMTYPVQISGASTIEKDGKQRTVLSAQNESIYLLDEGTTDVVTSETSGAATSASSTQITQASAGWSTNAFVDSSIYIKSGKGKGQYRSIASNTSDTITVTSAWTTTPDSTSTFSIGVIDWNWRTGGFNIGEAGSRERREVELKFKPTTNNMEMDIRLYYNNESSPVEFGMHQDLGDAVEIRDDNLENVVIQMGKNASTLGESTGRESFRFDGMYSQNSSADHKISVELRGYSGADRPKIDMVDIIGVEEGEG